MGGSFTLVASADQEPINAPSQSPSISPTSAVAIDEVGCGIDHCNRYFDGCNRCFCGTGSTPFCTKSMLACNPGMIMPKPFCTGCESGYILNKMTRKCEAVEPWSSIRVVVLTIAWHIMMDATICGVARILNVD